MQVSEFSSPRTAQHWAVCGFSLLRRQDTGAMSCFSSDAQRAPAPLSAHIAAASTIACLDQAEDVHTCRELQSFSKLSPSFHRAAGQRPAALPDNPAPAKSALCNRLTLKGSPDCVAGVNWLRRADLIFRHVARISGVPHVFRAQSYRYTPACTASMRRVVVI